MSLRSKIKSERAKADRVRKRNTALYESAVEMYAWWMRVNNAGGTVISKVSADRMRIGSGQTGILEYLSMFPDLFVSEPHYLKKPRTWLKWLVNLPSRAIRSSAIFIARTFGMKIMYTVIDVDLQAHFYKWKIMEILGGEDEGLTTETIAKKFQIPHEAVVASMEQIATDSKKQNVLIPKTIQQHLARHQVHTPEVSQP